MSRIEKKEAISHCSELPPLKIKLNKGTQQSCRELVLKYRPLLFQLFGETRYERVIHEFIAGFLDNPFMRPAAVHLLNCLLSDFDLNEIRGNDILEVESESKQPQQNIRIDILVKNLSKDWKLALELKVRPGTEEQAQGYRDWLNGNASRYLLWIGTDTCPIHHTRAKAYPWSEFGWFLKEGLAKELTGPYCPEEIRSFVEQFAQGLARMNGDTEKFKALNWYYTSPENAALIAIAHWDEVLLQKKYGFKREDIQAAKALQWYVVEETNKLIEMAEYVLLEICKKSDIVQTSKLTKGKKRGSRIECELNVLPKYAHEHKKHEHGTIGATFWRDTKGAPALILWICLPEGGGFAKITDGNKEKHFILFGDRDSRVLKEVPLRKQGGGGKTGGSFKSLEEIERDFRKVAKQALLHSGKQGKENLLKRMAKACE